MKGFFRLYILLSALSWATGTFAGELGLRTANFSTRDTSKVKHKKKPYEISSGASAKGNFVIQPTLNLGHHLGFGRMNSVMRAGHSYGGLIPGLTLNLDYNVHNYVSVGVYYSVAFQNYKTDQVFYLGHAFGERTVFHWWQLLDDKKDADLKSDNIDFDIHVHLGAYLLTEKNKLTGVKYKKWGFNGGGGVGFKYYFVKNFGVVFEAGYEEASWAKLGLVIKI